MCIWVCTGTCGHAWGMCLQVCVVARVPGCTQVWVHMRGALHARCLTALPDGHSLLTVSRCASQGPAGIAAVWLPESGQFWGPRKEPGAS